MGSETELFEKLRQAVLEYDEDLAIHTAKKVLESGINPMDAIENGLALGMKEVGDKFGIELFLTDLMEAADTMKAAIAILEPAIKESKVQDTVGTVVIGTVKGDIHDIGKNLVATMLSVSGFKVVDLGVDVPIKKFIRRAEEEKADVIAMSSLLSTTMEGMNELVQLLKEMGIRENFKVLVGGGQVTQEFSDEIGADGFAMDAKEAAPLIRKLLS